MNKQTFRGIISLIIFLLGAAVTLPLATGAFIDRLKPDNPPSDLTEDTDAPFTLPPVPTGIAQTTSEPPVETTSPELTTGTSTDDSSVVSEPVTSEPPETTAEITTAEITTEAVTTAPETTLRTKIPSRCWGSTTCVRITLAKPIMIRVKARGAIRVPE